MPAPAGARVRRRSGRACVGRRRLERRDRGAGRALVARSPTRRRALPRGLHAAPQASRSSCERATRWCERGERHRLGLRRDARLRHPAARRHAGPAHRPGHAAAARSATATPCSTTPRPATSYVPLNHLGRRAGRDRRSSTACCPSRGARLRVRLSPRRPAHAGHLGGAVRRLRQRRPGDHRPVHRRRRVASGSA